MIRQFKAFVSCSFSDEERELRDFFRGFIEGLGFLPVIYDFQEPCTIPDGIKEQMKHCDCLVAVVTKRHKLEGGDAYACPAWLPTEMAWADSFRMPVAVLVEEGVSLEGLPKIERHEMFNRSNLMQALPKITRYLQALRDRLVESDSPVSPVLVRNFVDSLLDVRSETESVSGAQVEMTALGEHVLGCHHASMRITESPEVDMKAKEFEFAVVNKPQQVEVSYLIDRSDEDRFAWRVAFTPPLTRGESVTYYYKRTHLTDQPFTLEAAKKRMKDPGFPLDTPSAYICWAMAYPTDRLRVTATLPENYVVSEPRFRVDIARSRIECEDEMRRLQTEKALQSETVMGRTRLVLDVRHLRIGCTYFLIWTPPAEKELPPQLRPSL